MKHLVRLILLSTILVPSMALAAGTATLVTNDDGPVQAVWAGSMLRIGQPNDNDGYMIFRNGHAYMVTTMNGAPRVIEMGGMIKTLGAMAGGTNGGLASVLTKDPQIDSLKATGETVTIAGIEGEVYRMTVSSRERGPETVDVVLTDDPRVMELTQVGIKAMGRMVDIGLTNEIRSALPAGKTGVLAVKNNFHIQSIATGIPPNDAFELPAAPQKLGGMIRQMFERLGTQ